MSLHVIDGVPSKPRPEVLTIEQIARAAVLDRIASSMYESEKVEQRSTNFPAWDDLKAMSGHRPYARVVAMRYLRLAKSAVQGMRPSGDCEDDQFAASAPARDCNPALTTDQIIEAVATWCDEVGR